MKIENLGEYEGEILNLDSKILPHGIGKLVTNDGAILEGKFYEGKLNGNGKITYTDGSSFEGNFRIGKLNGYGTQVYSNGNIYKGNFVDNIKVGMGRLYFKRGRYKYIECVWKDDEMFADFIIGLKNGTQRRAKIVNSKIHLIKPNKKYLINVDGVKPFSVYDIYHESEYFSFNTTNWDSDEKYLYNKFLVTELEVADLNHNVFRANPVHDNLDFLVLPNNSDLYKDYRAEFFGKVMSKVFDFIRGKTELAGVIIKEILSNFDTNKICQRIKKYKDRWLRRKEDFSLVIGYENVNSILNDLNADNLENNEFILSLPQKTAELLDTVSDDTLRKNINIKIEIDAENQQASLFVYDEMGFIEFTINIDIRDILKK